MAIDTALQKSGLRPAAPVARRTSDPGTPAPGSFDGNRRGSTTRRTRRAWLSRIKSVATWPLRKLAGSAIRNFGRKHRYEILYGLLLAQYATATVCAAAKLGIAELLKSGPKTRDELAESARCDAIALERVLRALTTIKVFRRDPQGRYSLTMLGETLLADSEQSVRDWAVVCADVLLPAMPGFVDSVRTGRNAFEETFGKPLWQHFTENPQLGQAFDRAMATSTATHVETIAAACDLSRSRRIVDVGGGRGALITALLRANPHLRGLLFDRDAVTPQTLRRIAEAGLADRCEVRGGSFLDEVPTGGDTYFIKHVLHDWPDDGVRTILRNVRRAMAPGSRLIVVEMLTEHAEWGRDFACKWYDFVQMVGPGGRERTRAEFESLLTEAGFRLHRVTPTALWDVTFLEALPA